MKVGVDFDLSGAFKWHDEEQERLKKSIEKIVKEAIEYTKRTKTYQNRTWTLVNSYKYKMDGFTPIIYNPTYYASFVEAKHYDVLTHGALWLERELRRRL